MWVYIWLLVVVGTCHLPLVVAFYYSSCVKMYNKLSVLCSVVCEYAIIYVKCNMLCDMWSKNFLKHLPLAFIDRWAF